MTMQTTPLLMSRILGRGAHLDPEVEVVTMQADGCHRQSLKQTWDRANQLAHALKGAGIGIGDRVGSFMWNNYRHLELYQGVPSMGAVLHTLNIRLSPVVWRFGTLLGPTASMSGFFWMQWRLLRLRTRT